MSVSPLAFTNSAQSSSQGVLSQRRAAFKALATALDSGDLAGAQSAFASLQAAKPGQSAPAAQDGPGADFQALSAALQSGDLAGAQKAFAALQGDLQKARGHHHHHHHHQPQAPSSEPTQSDGTTTLPGIDLKA